MINPKFSKSVRTSNHRSIMKSKGLFHHHIYKLIFLLIYHLHRIDAIKVDGKYFLCLALNY